MGLAVGVFVMVAVGEIVLVLVMVGGGLLVGVRVAMTGAVIVIGAGPGVWVSVTGSLVGLVCACLHPDRAKENKKKIIQKTFIYVFYNVVVYVLYIPIICWLTGFWYRCILGRYFLQEEDTWKHWKQYIRVIRLGR